MFDKRLMLMCPESKKYILGNILLQFLEVPMVLLHGSPAGGNTEQPAEDAEEVHSPDI